MKISFAPLATVTPVHPYYAEKCEDIDFFATPATTRLLQVGRMLARMQEGSLILLYEADLPNVPVSSLIGETLVFGMTIRNPYFENFTKPVLANPALTPLYANGALATKLDAAKGMQIVTGLHTYIPTNATRPATLTLKTATGQTVSTRTLGVGETSSSYDFRALPAGRYLVSEAYEGGGSGEQILILDSSLYAGNIFGVLTIKIDASFYLTPPVFELKLEAREETLRYYIVASNFQPGELNNLKTQLGVVDAGNNAQGGGAIAFTKKLAPFPAGELQDTLLAQSNPLVAIFESNTVIPRRERGFQKLHLNRNATTLINHLPLPRPENARADLIVHLSKP